MNGLGKGLMQRTRPSLISFEDMGQEIEAIIFVELGSAAPQSPIPLSSRYRGGGGRMAYAWRPADPDANALRGREQDLSSRTDHFIIYGD